MKIHRFVVLCPFLCHPQITLLMLSSSRTKRFMFSSLDHSISNNPKIKREFICSVGNIFHRKNTSRNFCGKYFPPFFSFPLIHLLLEVSFPESNKSSARSIQLFCLSTTAAIPALVTSWPHPGWPRPALVPSWPHSGWPCPALVTS